MAVKALVVGVSKYFEEKVSDLYFCKNDIIAIERALSLGMNIEGENIYTVGKTGVVTCDDFVTSLLKVSQGLEEEDTIIFYFSGHGATIADKHYLVFSDNVFLTNEIINYFEKMKCKSKIIFLDACLSGNFSVSGSSKFNIQQTITEFASKGYAVMASSNAQQYSYGHPQNDMSVFTYFLCNAFYDKLTVKQGKKSLYDIQKLVKLYLEIWNLKNPERKQEPIFRANMGGTVYFQVSEYKPYAINRIYDETDEYIIYNVNPVHSTVKRYSVNVILKEPFSIEEIGRISLEIKDKIKGVEVYKSLKSEEKFKGVDASIIWIFFGRDEYDMINNTFICKTTWVDDKQDREWWYRANNKNTFIINNIHYEIFTYYDSLKKFEKENMAVREIIIAQIKEILEVLVSDVEEFIGIYNEYRNGEYDEEIFVYKTSDLRKRIAKYYLLSTDLDFPPKELYEWNNACIGLFGTIHDFTLFYNEHGMKERDEKNRRLCTDLAIERYYEDLEKVKIIEDKLFCS